MQNAAEIAAKMGAGVHSVPIMLACAEYSIDNDRELAHFLAQLAVESADFKRTIESLNFSVIGLLNTFGRHRISAEDCHRYGRMKGRAANQPMIAERVYGGAWGLKHLGNRFKGDGYKFRGHGLGQITGRANVELVSKGLFGDLRLAVDPTPLTDPAVSARAAAFLWQHKGCDRHAARDDVIAVRKSWNGGLNGIDHAEDALKRAKKALQLP